MLKHKFLRNSLENRFSPQTRLLGPLVRKQQPLRVLVRTQKFSDPPPGPLVDGQGSSPLFQCLSTLRKPQMPQTTTRTTRSGQMGINSNSSIRKNLKNFPKQEKQTRYNSEDPRP